MKQEQRLEVAPVDAAIVPLPETVILSLIDGHFSGLPVTTDNEVATEFVLYRTPITVAGIPDAELLIEYRKYVEKWDDEHDALIFTYTTGSGPSEQPVAILEFNLQMPRCYRLNHRYVEPSYRNRRGVGTQLLRQAEQFFQQLAYRTRERQRLEINLGQSSVLQWALKNGFIPEPSHQAKVQQVLHHPEEFVIHDVMDDRDDLLKTNCIFPRDTKEFTMAQTVRLSLYKIIDYHTVRAATSKSTDPETMMHNTESSNSTK